MRRTRDETQLTRAISALGKHDETLTSKLAKAILATAAQAGHEPAAQMLTQVPASLRISNEVRVEATRRKPAGRLDWQFKSDAFRLVVEVKIGTTAADGQLKHSWARSHALTSAAWSFLRETRSPSRPTLDVMFGGSDRFAGIS